MGGGWDNGHSYCRRKSPCPSHSWPHSHSRPCIPVFLRSWLCMSLVSSDTEASRSDSDSDSIEQVPSSCTDITCHPITPTSQVLMSFNSLRSAESLYTSRKMAYACLSIAPRVPFDTPVSTLSNNKRNWMETQMAIITCRTKVKFPMHDVFEDGWKWAAIKIFHRNAGIPVISLLSLEFHLTVKAYTSI